MANIPYKTLHNGLTIPQIGLGVYKVPPEEAYETVTSALELGYRHIDTASFYGNEEGVGKAIRESGIPREEIFLTTKVWNDEQGYDETLQAYERSLSRLGLDYVDLYLIHWPVPELFVNTWKAMEKLYNDGAVKAIGVSNFLAHHLQELAENAEHRPAVDQIELHPKLVQKETVDYCRNNEIAVQSWSPLGRAKYLDDVQIAKIAEKYGKSPAQIILRWHVQKDFIVIPKSTKRTRQQENINIFDFALTAEDMQQIDQMEAGLRVGSHPDNPPNYKGNN